MLKEWLPGLYIDSIKTGYQAVPQLNLSIIPGKDRSLLVDAGMPERFAPGEAESLTADLKELGIPFEKLDCIITHSHRDHVGLAPFLNRMGARVFLNPEDMRKSAEDMNYEVMHADRREKLFRFFGLELSDRKIYDDFWRAADAFVDGFEDAWDFSWEPIVPGEVRNYGNYSLRITALPGHTRGHIGLWDADRKVLFSGDQLVHGVTPIVSDTGDYPHALEDYFDSMRTVKHLCNDCLLIPGHGEPFRHPEADAEAAVQSYLEKCTVMYDMVRHSDKPLCIRGVGVRAYGRKGKELTVQQQRSCLLIWFKTCACLNYMKDRGLVKETIIDGVSYWTA